MDYRERILLGDKWKYALPKKVKRLTKKASLYKMVWKVSKTPEINVYCGNWYIKNCPFRIRVGNGSLCIWHLVAKNSKDACPLYLVLRKGYENWKKIKAWERRVKS